MNINHPFEYTFVDAEYDQLYKSEMKLSLLFRYFTIIAIFIACLGLYGLSTFIAEVRIKEIGIRKTLGASVPGVVWLLSKEFTRFVIAANIIAFPIAYYSLNSWLKNFAYRITIGYWIFILAALLSLSIALFTISFRVIKTARANPAEALRYE